MTWMRNHGFFDSDGLGLSENDVYFESTRIEKIERIKKLGCTHFIDDLEELFLEESFPGHVGKILFAPYGMKLSLRGVIVASSWKDIHNYFFNEKVK